VSTRRAAILLLLPLATACAHEPPPPPASMARLLIDCCRLVGAKDAGGQQECKRSPRLESAAVVIDGVERGTCADWRRKGDVFEPGRHVVQVQVPLDGPLEEGQCCVDGGAYFTLRKGETHTQRVGLKAFREPD
jgi:hypothetical protein